MQVGGVHGVGPLLVRGGSSPVEEIVRRVPGQNIGHVPDTLERAGGWHGSRPGRGGPRSTLFGGEPGLPAGLRPWIGWQSRGGPAWGCGSG